MVSSFTHQSRPGRVIFGQGTMKALRDEAAALGLQRVLVLSSPGQRSAAEALSGLLGDRAAGLHPNAIMHTPTEVTETALQVVRREKIDGLVAIGGGSAIGLSKALAHRTDLPQIVLPTTYAGSEMTPILGETFGGVKKTLNHPSVLPETVIYDVDLTLSLPPRLSAVSGLNAMAHAIEALYAKDRNPIISLMALEAVRSLSHSLPEVLAKPYDLGARTEALYGAWLCGTCLGAVGMALHHKICHTLGGSFNLPHAETHAVILPHALAFNSPAIPDVMQSLQRNLGQDPANALYRLGGALGAPRSLRDLGMPSSGIERAAEAALANPYWNPQPLRLDAIRALLFRAWAGEPPEPPEVA